ncbi:hypothetical protein HBI56_045920 [Parastagonospora nodorum]|uniref:Uncharacterized protein n=2 Tax=Phaeosphaeria nodorum (strain SN15 / ATCC MYA-4574 / FGSC 10173) TaxID=321614 RepID=A0A7U2EVE2_PHANO|nr:hypothetical protein SNOG_01976 [Parastagonospora nodorum SN15]KAH3916472.1 hypothetical protein HBH56_059070 [Parastagonospora nodorum]EAT90188.1 hypothetical protein SNOG_01976 [Parastagonospora nodorum SN15]KAH3931081.1 hypothetical protein HBH54_103000 [Parastagonospora nodorum]KAH3943955.1 hypothetical protein HBH53_166290 [Parastagonospora nodorum]KAH3965276.1 hypothetical protein HBH51_151750 [Parastagonospora nodorum]
MRNNNNKSYMNIGDERNERRGRAPWYWRLVALASSWMILAGYLILPGLYAKDPTLLKFRQAILSVFVVAFLTAGYSFTALLCFACRNELFQAESVFLPALASSAFGLISIAYNFLSSHSYMWGISAISGTVLSATATLTYGALLLWTHHRIVKIAENGGSRQLWSNESYYTNYVHNMYPTATRSPAATPEAPIAEYDPVNQQMALLLMKSDPRPSPDAHSTTFRIDMPEDREQMERQAYSQELVGTLGQVYAGHNRNRAESRPDSLSEQQAWERWQDRGRAADRPPSIGQRSNHSRGLSREERRREIELGHP